jgi:hypothetical protein
MKRVWPWFRTVSLEKGNPKFGLAVARWRDESWFYRYADAYKALGNL